MIPRYMLQFLAVVTISVFVTSTAQAVVTETVPVGNIGNAGQWSGDNTPTWGPRRLCGAVDYAYNIGTYEVTAGQYTDFLNAVAATDTYGLYNTQMWSNEYGCKIQRNGDSGSFQYSVASTWADRPVNYVSWGDAARYTNWLHNGQPTGLQGAATTEAGSYSLNGATGIDSLIGVGRQGNATWVIPSDDEWYKAAYHKNDGATANYWDYPTQTDSVPSNNLTPDIGNNANYKVGASDYTIGSPYYRTDVGEFSNSESPYGTFDQAGNAWEWVETRVDTEVANRGLRGGCMLSDANTLMDRYRGTGRVPTSENPDLGFRVANVGVVPEPSSITLLAVGALGLLAYGWRRRNK